MAITTLAQVRSGLQFPQFFTKTAGNPANRWYSAWPAAGTPAAGGYDSTLNGVTLSATQTGQIPFTNPNSGNAYLAKFSCNCQNVNAGGTLLLCDRLWHNGGFTITSTAAQNITSPTWPARDENAATAGLGVYIGAEISASVGAGTPTITLSYTNSGGTAGQSGTNIIATVASSATGSFYPIGLAAGDVGVQSVQSMTLSATWTSGTMNLVAYRVLASMDVTNIGAVNGIDAITGALPKILNNSVPFLLWFPSTGSSPLGGEVTYTWG